MKAFAKLIIVACIGLLSWWQKDFHLQTELTTAALILFGIMAGVLTARSRRLGYWLAGLLGLGYFVEIVWMVDRSNRYYMSPLLGWAFALFAASMGLLWVSRERSSPKAVYERHPEY